MGSVLSESVWDSVRLMKLGALLRERSNDLREYSVLLRTHCLEILGRLAAARRESESYRHPPASL